MLRKNFPRRAEKRRQEAKQRQEAHDKLTIKQKVAKLNKNKHAAIKERQRLVDQQVKAVEAKA